MIIILILLIYILRRGNIIPLYSISSPISSICLSAMGLQMSDNDSESDDTIMDNCINQEHT